MKTISEYSRWQASRPERDFETERQQNRQSDPDIQKAHGLSDKDFAYVRSIGDFPKIIDPDKRIPVRTRDQVEEWFARMHRILGVKSR